MKKHDLKGTIVRVNDEINAVSYFYTREKNDRNGNARFRVYITDVDAPAVYETIFKCYEFEIDGRVKRFIEQGAYND